MVILEITFLVLLVLKLTKMAEITWLVVFSPIIVEIILFILAVALMSVRI